MQNKDNSQNSQTNAKLNDLTDEKLEQIKRGARIKYIREQELKITKTRLAEEIGISSQFLGLVEDGKGNLVYKSLKKLRDISGHSADYILYGIDDDAIRVTSKYLKEFSEKELITAVDMLKDLSILIRNN